MPAPCKKLGFLKMFLNISKHLGDDFLFPDPYEVIENMGQKLTVERFQFWPNQEHTIKIKVFNKQLVQLS